MVFIYKYEIWKIWNMNSTFRMIFIDLRSNASDSVQLIIFHELIIYAYYLFYLWRMIIIKCRKWNEETTTVSCYEYFSWKNNHITFHSWNLYVNEILYFLFSRRFRWFLIRFTFMIIICFLRNEFGKQFF